LNCELYFAEILDLGLYFVNRNFGDSREIKLLFILSLQLVEVEN